MMTPTNRKISLPLRLTFATVVVFVLALASVSLVMQPGLADLKEIAIFLSITSVFTLLTGQLAYRMGWINRAPSLRYALFGTYVLSSLLTFINVWLTAQLMFASRHDLLLGIILLLFASGMAISLGYFFTEALSDRLSNLRDAAGKIQKGELSTRVEVKGSDEIAQFGDAFNTMLEQLESATLKQQELEQLRRDLIAWVSHDLQTPLASIRAVIEALADGMVEDDGSRERYLSAAKRDIQSLSRLIDDLFELAQMDAGGLKLNLQVDSLSDLISDTVESFNRLAAEKRVTISCQIGDGVDYLLMDAYRIGRILTNLVGNALRHTPAEGEIVLTATSIGQSVEVAVIDSGPGFRPEDLPHLFDRFFRGEKSRSRVTGGVGLGLAIAKGFAEAHHGEIIAENLPAGGACFRLRLPERAVDQPA